MMLLLWIYFKFVIEDDNDSDVASELLDTVSGLTAMVFIEVVCNDAEENDDNKKRELQ